MHKSLADPGGPGTHHLNNFKHVQMQKFLFLSHKINLAIDAPVWEILDPPR